MLEHCNSYHCYATGWDQKPSNLTNCFFSPLPFSHPDRCEFNLTIHPRCFNSTSSISMLCSLITDVKHLSCRIRHPSLSSKLSNNELLDRNEPSLLPFCPCYIMLWLIIFHSLLVVTYTPRYQDWFFVWCLQSLLYSLYVWRVCF